MAPEVVSRISKLSPGRQITMFCFFLLTVTLIQQQPVQAKLPINFQNVLEVGDPSAFKTVNGFKMLYFFVNMRDASLEFFHEYEKAAQFLSQYKFRTGIVDCSNVEDPICMEPDIGTNIFLYKNEEVWTSLNLVNMFDVNSIASNALQFALLDVVDIINTKVERLAKMAPLQGEKDVVFGYFSAIGTYVHRVFMEVAYAFNNRVQFMFTNSPRAVSDLEMPMNDSNSIIWFFKCKRMPSSSEEKAVGNCPSILYRGTVTLNSFLWALRLFDGPKFFQFPSDGAKIPCQAVHCLYLYYDTQRIRQMLKTVNMIVGTYQGLFAIVLVDVNSVIADGDAAAPVVTEWPLISMTFAKEDNHYHYKKNITQEDLFEFIDQTLLKAPNNTESDLELEDLGPLDDNDELFFIDDEVAAAVFESRNLNIDVSSLTALTDKTFAVAEASPNITLVLFYKNNDPVGISLLQHLSEWMDSNAANFTELSLTSMNCFDWTDVCRREGILHSPTVRLIGQQHRHDAKMVSERTYTGALNPKDIVSFLFKYTLNGTLKLNAEDARQLLRGQYRNLFNITSYCLLGLFAEGTPEMEAFEIAAKKLKGKVLFAVIKNEELESFVKEYEFTIPSMLALRWNDPVLPITVNQGPFSQKNILEFTKSSMMPLFPELLPDVLPVIYQTKRPLLILFWKADDPSYVEIKNLAETGAFSNVIFTWLNLTSYTDYGVQIIETYFTIPSIPALSMVYFNEHRVYNFMGKMIKEEFVHDWIKRLMHYRDIMEPSYRMKDNEWKPQKESFDFLKDHPFDEWENSKSSKVADAINTMPLQSPPEPVHEEL